MNEKTAKFRTDLSKAFPAGNPSIFRAIEGFMRNELGFEFIRMDTMLFYNKVFGKTREQRVRDFYYGLLIAEYGE
jgi:hypothetical protein